MLLGTKIGVFIRNCEFETDTSRQGAHSGAAAKCGIPEGEIFVMRARGNEGIPFCWWSYFPSLGGLELKLSLAGFPNCGGRCSYDRASYEHEGSGGIAETAA